MDSLLGLSSRLNLEVESQGKLQLPHCRTAFQARDLPVVASLTVYAGLGSIVCAERVNRMIEHIESVRAELETKPLGDQESL